MIHAKFKGIQRGEWGQERKREMDARGREEEDGSYNDLFLKLNSLPLETSRDDFVIFGVCIQILHFNFFVDYEGLLHFF